MVISFVLEARLENGEQYPATTITSILFGLWRYARSQCHDCPNFMDQWDRDFEEPNDTFEKVFRKLTEDSVSAVEKHAAVNTLKKQGLLWTAGPLVLLASIPH